MIRVRDEEAVLGVPSSGVPIRCLCDLTGPRVSRVRHISETCSADSVEWSRGLAQLTVSCNGEDTSQCKGVGSLQTLM